MGDVGNVAWNLQAIKTEIENYVDCLKGFISANYYREGFLDYSVLELNRRLFSWIWVEQKQRYDDAVTEWGTK